MPRHIKPGTMEAARSRNAVSDAAMRVESGRAVGVRRLDPALAAADHARCDHAAQPSGAVAAQACRAPGELCRRRRPGRPAVRSARQHGAAASRAYARATVVPQSIAISRTSPIGMRPAADPIGFRDGHAAQDYACAACYQRAAASSSLARASTQRSPSGVCSFFQNGARVLR